MVERGEGVVVGVLGASSLVGRALLPMLVGNGYAVLPYTRKPHAMPALPNLPWVQLGSPLSAGQPPHNTVSMWVCLAPIWELPAYFSLIGAAGVRRIVVLSSTSRFTKVGSDLGSDSAVAQRLIDGEQRLQAWATEHGVEWVILRPTLIYGNGRDRNVTEIARFVQRFSFFPLLDKAKGLRQPIHMDDVAQACLAALSFPAAANRAYNIAGREVLQYRDLVMRIFQVLGRKPRLLSIPRGVFRVALVFARITPRYRDLSISMADRMNKDMVFDWSDASRDLGFSPRSFQFGVQDLPHSDTSH